MKLLIAGGYKHLDRAMVQLKRVGEQEWIWGARPGSFILERV